MPRQAACWPGRFCWLLFLLEGEDDFAFFVLHQQVVVLDGIGADLADGLEIVALNIHGDRVGLHEGDCALEEDEAVLLLDEFAAQVVGTGLAGKLAQRLCCGVVDVERGLIEGLGQRLAVDFGGQPLATDAGRYVGVGTGGCDHKCGGHNCQFQFVHNKCVKVLFSLNSRVPQGRG